MEEKARTQQVTSLALDDVMVPGSDGSLLLLLYYSQA